MSDTEQSAYRRAGGADMTPTAHERAGKIANDFFLIKPTAPLIAAIERAITEAEAAARADENYECSQIADRHGDPEIRDAIISRGEV